MGAEHGQTCATPQHLKGNPMVARKHQAGKRPQLIDPDIPLPNDVPTPEDQFALSEGTGGAVSLAPPKIPKPALYRVMSAAINGAESWLPPFTTRFRVTQASKGALEVLEEHKGGIVEVVPLEYVAQVILRYTERELVGRPAYQWDTKDCAAAAKSWQWGYVPPEPMPPAVRWADDPGLSFSVLPWRRGERGPTPLFDELMSRVSNAKAVKAWIGSLFDPGSDRQQYVWMYGDGGDGKGALTRFLKRVFDRAYRALEVPTRDTQRFWAMQMAGCRLGCFSECDEDRFPSSGYFKKLTGNDPLPTEEKGGGFFTRTITAKFLFTSQEKPRLKSTRADIRRVILSHVKPFAGPAVADYEDRLFAEGGNFLGECLALYDELCPDRGPVDTDTTELITWISEVEEGFSTFAKRWFNFGATLTEYPEVVWDVISTGFARRDEREEFKKYLERSHGVVKKPERVEGKDKPIYLYVGCTVKRSGTLGMPGK